MIFIDLSGNNKTNVDIVVVVVKQTEKLKRKRKYQPIPLVFPFKTVWRIEDADLIIIKVFDEYVELNQFTSPYDALWIVLVQVS